MNNTLVVNIGNKRFESQTIRELIGLLVNEQRNLNESLLKFIKSSIVDDIEVNFIGTPAECRAALVEADTRAALEFASAKMQAVRNQRHATLDAAITDLIFKASGLTSRKAFDVIDNYVSQDATSEMERLDVVEDLADLFKNVAAAAATI